MKVAIDLEAGEARLGTLSVAVAGADGAGGLRDGGDVLRPLSFGDRLRVCSWALGAADPRGAVASGIAQAASLRRGEADRRLVEVLALALAGAGEAAPPFAEAGAAVARAGGWQP